MLLRIILYIMTVSKQKNREKERGKREGSWRWVKLSLKNEFTETKEERENKIFELRIYPSFFFGGGGSEERGGAVEEM